MSRTPRARTPCTDGAGVIRLRLAGEEVTVVGRSSVRQQENNSSTDTAKDIGCPRASPRASILNIESRSYWKTSKASLVNLKCVDIAPNMSFREFG